MASASRATARMSAAAELAAMRYSGSSRASAFFAGSSEGNGLSVMAMIVLATEYSTKLCHARQSRLKSKHLRIDAVRQFFSFQGSENITDHDGCHLFTHFGRGAAEMRGEHDIGHPPQAFVDLWFVLENIESGAGDLLALKRAHERRFIDDGAARGIDEKGAFL